MISHKRRNPKKFLKKVRSNWYYRTIYYNVTQGNLDCCSDKLTQMHYINPHDDNFNETKPRKLELSEILERTDAESYRSIFIREHRKQILKWTDYKSSLEEI